MASEQTQGKRYGVLIASSSFPDEPKLHDLRCPDNDVDGMEKVLADAGMGGFTEVAIFKNEPHHVVLRGIHQVLRKADRDDLVLIFYAGHGKLDRAGRLHLATVDTVNDELETTSIPATRIRELFENADTRKTALILDCCYSGAIEKSFLRGDVDEQLNIMAGGQGTFIMTASTGLQTAREEMRDGFGLFTKHVIGGIEGGAADADGDGVVTMNELYNYVHRQVRNEGHQEPMKWDLNVQGELVVAQTGRKPREERRRAVREKLFALADQGLLPDMVLTRALEVSNLSYAETRQGAAAKYDSLLDRVLEDDLRVGRFVDDWLKVPPDEAPVQEVHREERREAKPEPKPEAKHEPAPPPKMDAEVDEPDDLAYDPAAYRPLARPDVGLLWKFLVWPYPATQENLDRNPYYRLFHGADVKRRRQVRKAALAQSAQLDQPTHSGQSAQSAMPKADTIRLVLWLVFGFPFILLIAQIYEDSNISYFASSSYGDSESGGITGAVVWAALGLILWRRGQSRLNMIAKSLYVAGIAACVILIGVILDSV